MINDDIFKNSDIISLNETHLGHSDTLTSDMMGIGKDVLIVHCDCNNKGGWVAFIVNTKLKPQTDQNEPNFGNSGCRDK